MKSLIMIFIAVLTFQMNAQDIVGDWNGELSYQETTLRVVFHVTGQNGKYSSTMDSPDQGAAGVAMEKTTFEDGKLTIKASVLQMEYTAELDDKGESLKGIFKQGGVSIPLDMTKLVE
jgi:hypothetical protein